MPLRTQCPAYKRSPHSDEPIEHVYQRRVSKMQLSKKIKRKRILDRREQRDRRHEQHLERVAQYVAIRESEEYRRRQLLQHAPADRACAVAAQERALAAKRRHTRRRSAEYYVTWVERFARYVERRVWKRGKRLSKRAVDAIVQAKASL